MRKLAFIASSLVFTLAVFAGCRGAVEREYVNDQQPITATDGGHLDAGLDAETGTSGEGEGGTPNKDKDAASEAGPPPKTAAAAITVTVNDGLFGTGLVLQNNGGDDLAIASPGSYTFETKVPPGQPYSVTIANQPIGPTQTCTVVDGSGTAAGEDVGGIKVNCATATFAVGGSVVGLSAGQFVTLTNNGVNDLTVNADGTFTFPAQTSGAPFNVVVKSQSAATTCIASGNTGTIGTAAVDSVVVNCGTNTYTVGGTVTGIVGSLVIQNNGGNDRTITSSGNYAFSTPIKSGNAYAVTVKSNPTYDPQRQQPQAQTCTVTNASGSVGVDNVTNVNISCVTNKYTVSGTVKGLTGSGLKLQNKGTDDKSIASGSNGFTFATPVPSGSTYNVTVVTQPSGQTCSVQNASGTIGKFNVSNVVVNCAAVNPLQQNFNGAAVGGLPDQWTSVGLFKGNQPGDAWTVQVDGADSNYAYLVDFDTERDIALTSPSFFVTSGSATLTFRHTFDLEGGWDGGVLEINVAGTGWKDILAAGGSFVSNGYNNPKLENDGTNQIAGRAAWNGYSDWLTSVVTLPSSAAGQSVQLRWRLGTDNGSGGDGWAIDDILVTN